VRESFVASLSASLVQRFVIVKLSLD
jgi:hypothetical protein